MARRRNEIDNMNTHNRVFAPRRYGQEIAPGVHYDPVSESRADYDGALSAYEAALAQTKSIVDAIGGGAASHQSVDAVWDAALDIAAHIVETRGALDPFDRRELCAAIRAMKKQRS